MRRWFAILTLGVLALGTTQAEAGILPVTGYLAISIAGLPPLFAAGAPTISTTQSGNHINAISIPASPFSRGGQVIAVTDPAAAPIKGIQATIHNGAGSFSGSPLGGLMAVNGVSKVCLFKACSNATANISVPLSVVGAGGVAAVSGSVSVTVVGAPWTAGTAAVGTVTQMGFQHGPASATSSTAANSGAIRLVTPIFISTNLPASAVVPGFGIMSLHVVVQVPEPATLLFLGGGIAGLVLLGRAKRS